MCARGGRMPFRRTQTIRPRAARSGTRWPLTAQSDWAQLQRHDQLQRQIEHGQAFCGFDAATETLCFAPTFDVKAGDGPRA